MRCKKLLSIAMVAAMLGTSLVGCSGKTEDTGSKATSDSTETKKVTLTVWGPQEDQKPIGDYKNGILPAMCEAFNEAHPEWDITFKYEVCSESDAKDVVTKDVAAAADVYMFANDQIPVLAEAGALAKIGGTNAENIAESNDEKIVSSVTYNGDLYGVPYTSNTWFMYYDKSLYSEDDVKSLDTMMEKDLGKGITNFAFPLDNSWYIEAFYYAAGGTLFGDGTTVDASKGCTFDDDNCVEMTKYMAKLAKNTKFSCEKEGSSIAKFKDGKLGAYCSGSWDAAAIKEALGDNFAVATLPTIEINGTGGQMKSFSGSKAAGVNPMTENPEVAVALAVYLGGEECQQIRYETRGIIPTNTKVAASESVQADEIAQVQAKEISDASAVQPVLTEMNNYWTPAETMGKEIVQGDVTDKNAKEKTEAMVKGILGK